jgi:hypothetical protein
VVTDDFACRVIPKLKALADNSRWLAMARCHTFGGMDESLFNYQKHNVSTHHGQDVRKRLAKHPRFHCPPVHCSWMNQVEQWFSILQRKRLRIVDFDSKDHLRAKIDQFIVEWNQ